MRRSSPRRRRPRRRRASSTPTTRGSCARGTCPPASASCAGRRASRCPGPAARWSAASSRAWPSGTGGYWTAWTGSWARGPKWSTSSAGAPETGSSASSRRRPRGGPWRPGPQRPRPSGTSWCRPTPWGRWPPGTCARSYGGRQPSRCTSPGTEPGGRRPTAAFAGSSGREEDTVIPDDPQTRQDMVALARHAEALGLVAYAQGNLSARIPGTPYVLITPSGLPYTELRAEDIVTVDLDGRRVHGNFVYLFGGRGLGQVPARRSGTAEFARASVEALAGHFGVVWKNHGLFCVGQDLRHAFNRCVAAEQAARVYYLALLLRAGPVEVIPKDVEEDMVATAEALGWARPL